MVYLGQRTGWKGKVSHYYLKLTGPDDNDGREANLDSIASLVDNDDVGCWTKPLATGRPGSVHTWEAKDPQASSVFTQTAKYVGQWKNQDDVVAWQAAHDADRANERAMKVEKSDKRANVPMEVLDPFRAAYYSLSSQARNQLIAQVVRYITK
jgi:hypothetical protein